MPITYWGYVLLDFPRPSQERVYGEIADLLAGREPPGTERFEWVEGGEALRGDELPDGRTEWD
jgi:hypothetical protein